MSDEKTGFDRRNFCIVSSETDGSNLKKIELNELSEMEQVRFIVDRAGICTAYDTTREDVGKIIQNRVRIYVSENLA